MIYASVSLARAFTPSLPNFSNNSLIDLHPDALANAASPSHPVGVTVTWWTFLGSPNLGSEPGIRLAWLFGCFPLVVIVAPQLSSYISSIPHCLNGTFQIIMDSVETRRHKKTPVDAGAFIKILTSMNYAAIELTAEND